MILTALDVAGYALRAGFTPTEAIIAVAIAHAESGFNDQAIGDVNLTESGEQSTGLWQINYRPSRDAGIKLRDPHANLNPAFNAVAAYAVSLQGVRFSPWSTYLNGAYLNYVNEAHQAVVEFMKEDTMSIPTSKIIGFQCTPTGKGYWVIFDDGAIFAFGDAEYHGRPYLPPTGVWQVEQ